ncbi:hypothetical protein FKW77_007051 [Venturia effusa]|uniref:CoA-binding domain-containing protein n=1 Tax=Venturia effusa TaxID=50376 RepID=A0A517LB38_9PEZI|nr:hypothetical protein FKW77_007051 [Venturia effusa]
MLCPACPCIRDILLNFLINMLYRFRNISCQARLRQKLGKSRSFASTPRRNGYDDTIGNLKIGADTRVIFQGFTGKQATANAQESIEWGTNIVGGVRPGKTGEHLGLPVLPTVRKAMEELKPHATGIYVAAHQATAAIEEAIEAEVPLIVAVAEHIPLHDILRIHSMLQTQSKSRLVGANAPGIISAIGKCRIGFQPLPTFSPGHVGIVAKSGTLSYEAVASLTRAGLGQSLCIGMGGDVIAGTNFVDALKVFENDADTECIVLIGEVGGTSEEEAADWIRDYKRRAQNPKPIAALVGGLCAKPGRVMGHAGAWAAPGEGNSLSKWEALEKVGVTMVDHPAKFGSTIKQILSSSGRDVKGIMNSANSAAHQKRGFHTYRTRPRVNDSLASSLAVSAPKRSLHLQPDHSANLLKDYSVEISPIPQDGVDSRLLVITIDRTARSPCIIASPTIKEGQTYQRALHIPFTYGSGPTEKQISRVLEHLQLDAAPPAGKAAAVHLVQQLSRLFHDKEAVSLEVQLSIPASSDTLQVHSPKFTFDDAAFKSTKRHQELHAQRDVSQEDAVEVSAEADGIVHIKLDAPTPNDAPRNIGTLVNGAGLAMNTVDALATRGGYAANFLDTGGKATSETVKKSFELIMQDDRVKVIFVNIFGGLTLGDMIARGIILAFKELSISVPVVVRIRGTREEEGQKLIAESGLDLYAFDDFEEAAAKVVELANGTNIKPPALPSTTHNRPTRHPPETPIILWTRMEGSLLQASSFPLCSILVSNKNKGAAASLKYARAQDLPSFPSVGIDTQRSGLSAATIAHGNKTIIEWWKPEQSAAAGKAAMLAKDYKMAPLWQPEASAAGSRAAILAAQGPGREWWQPTASKEGNSAATIAMRNKNLSPQTDYGYTETGKNNSLLAARRSVKGRKRADSTPARLAPETYPDERRAGQNALAAAYSADSNKMGSNAMEAARVHNIGKNVGPEFFGEKPPIRMEVEEKKHQDALRASAVSMAKQMYANQSVDDDGNITVNSARAAARSSQPTATPEKDIKKEALQYLTLQEAAQRLAAERLAKIDNQFEQAAFREYYGYPTQKGRSRLSVTGNNSSRRRAASANDGAADSDSDDEFRARRVRNQQSQLNDSVAQIDARKRTDDRASLMAAAERKVQAQMDQMDKKVFDDTGKMSPAMMEDWDSKARARALAASEARMQHHGQVHVGGGKYLGQSEIDEIARKRIQPTLDDINERSEKQRAKDEEARLDEEERKREARLEKQRQAELKAIEKRSKHEEKQAEKSRKQEEKIRSKEEKEAAKVDHQVDQDKKSEWKKLISSKSEKRKSKQVDPLDQLEATPVLPEDNVGQSLERAATGSSSIADVDIIAHRNASATNPADATDSPTHEPSDAIDRARAAGNPTYGDKFERQEPKSPSKKRFSGMLGKLKRKSKSASKEEPTTTEKGFEGGAAYTGAFATGIPQEGKPPVERSPSISSLSSEDGEENAVHTSAAAAENAGSSEQERGRSKKRVVDSSDDEFEEARDTFDDSALAPPPKLLSTKTGSPARETKFVEAL